MESENAADKNSSQNQIGIHTIITRTAFKFNIQDLPLSVEMSLVCVVTNGVKTDLWTGVFGVVVVMSSCRLNCRHQQHQQKNKYNRNMQEEWKWESTTGCESYGKGEGEEGMMSSLTKPCC